MSLFRCSSCGCVENTALSRYWAQYKSPDKLCSECNPEIGRWHGRFPKQDADANGYVPMPDMPNYIEKAHG